ncbi:MAG: hypothetical protein OXB93_04375, partial [Cytophagales bacterium]|nr:hypothetical protein [Cytophagales bacterium]
CQQDIGEEGKGRMESLEAYVKNEANTKADSVKKDYQNFLKQLKIQPSTRSYQGVLNVFGEATQQKLRGILEKFHSECEKRYKIICDEDFSKISSSANTDFSHISETLKTSLNKTMEKIKKQETDLQRLLNEKEKVEEERVNLSLGKFLNDIKDDQDLNEYLKSQNALDGLISSNRLTGISTKLSEGVGEKFKEEFNKEYESLTNKYKHVRELDISSSGRSGKRAYAISIKGAKERIPEVFSEGEQRIIALALFLAEMGMGENKAPFIFDDPVSSLDDGHQGRVAKRLIELAKDRQVIVFTHRFPLLVDLEREMTDNEQEKANRIKLEASSEKTGISNSWLYSYRKMDFNKGFKMFYNDLSKLKEDAHKDELIGMCTRLRSLLETFVETRLLGGIVVRSRENIQMLNLKRINLDEDTVSDIKDLYGELSNHVHPSSHERIKDINLELLEKYSEVLLDHCPEGLRKEIMV